MLPGGVADPARDHPWQHLDELVLPVLTLVIAVTPYIVADHAGLDGRGARERLRRDGPAQGDVRSSSVVWRHAVPNAIAPTIQVIALNLAYLAGGIVVVEYVFGYPGIGAALVDAVANRDLPVVQALAILIAAVYVLLNVARRRRRRSSSARACGRRCDERRQPQSTRCRTSRRRCSGGRSCC